MLRVVELHDLAADGRLKGTIIVCIIWSVHGICVDCLGRQDVQGRSGRVALPRVKVVLAKAARFAAEGALALRAERTAELRKTAAEDMFDQCSCVRPEVREQETIIKRKRQRTQLQLMKLS